MFSSGKNSAVSKYTSSSTFGGVDPYYNRTVLHITGDGTVGVNNSTYDDASDYNTTLARGASTNAQGSFSPYSPAGWSMQFNYSANADYIWVPYASDYRYDPASSTNWTLECWIWPKTFTGWSDTATIPGSTVFTLIGNMSYTLATANMSWSFGIDGTGRVGFYYYSTGGASNWNNVFSTATVNLNQWNHIAVTKTASGISVFCNGVGTTPTAVVGTMSTGYINDTTIPLLIGAFNVTNVATNYINGYVSNIRINNTTALYSGTSYTVPTSALTTISGTTLLLGNVNRWYDVSSYDAQVTVVGTPWILPFSPFSPTTAYSPTTHSGSLYSSTTTDYVGSTLATMASTQYHLALNDSDFTLEGWFYPLTATTSAVAVFSNISGDTNNKGIAIQLINSAGSPGANVLLVNGATAPAYQITRPLNAFSWSHVAVTRQNGVIRIFQNGQLVSTSTDTGTQGLGNTIYNVPAITVGNRSYARNTAYVGYTSDFRMTRGVALYTSSFTLPGSSLQPVSYASQYAVSQYYVCQFNGATKGVNFGDPFLYNASPSLATQGVNFTHTYLDANGLNVTSGFCLEFFIYFNTSLEAYPGSATLAIVGSATGTANTLSIQFFRDGLSIANNGYFAIAVPSGIFKFEPGRWYHFALIGSTTNYVAVDGVVYNTTRIGGGAGYTENGIWNFSDYIGHFDGYIRDYRITTGSTVYGTSNFVRPHTPLTTTVTGGTVQLLMFNGPTISDATGNASNITTLNNSRGSPTMVANLGGTQNTLFTQQSPTTACLNFKDAGYYDATGKNVLFIGTGSGASFPTISNTIAGALGSPTTSLTFFGASNWIRIPNSPLWDFGSGEWMFDFWIYLANITTAQTIFSKKATAAGFGPVQIDISTTGKIVVKISTNGTATTQTLTTTTSLTINTWQYVAVYKYFDGTNYRVVCSINGSSAGGALSAAGNLTVVANAIDVTIGNQSIVASQPLIAGTYLDDFRVTRSVRGYTATSFPPTPTKMPGIQ
jgi:hypothetical protein